MKDLPLFPDFFFFFFFFLFSFVVSFASFKISFGSSFAQPGKTRSYFTTFFVRLDSLLFSLFYISCKIDMPQNHT